MHLIHTTRDGDRMFIAQMEDEHLRHTVNLILTKVESGMDLSGSVPQISNNQAAVFGIDIVRAKKQALKAVPHWLSALYPYLAEAFLRFGFNDDPNGEWLKGIRNRMRTAMEREGAMPPLGLERALPSGTKGDHTLLAFTDEQNDRDGMGYESGTHFAQPTRRRKLDVRG